MPATATPPERLVNLVAAAGALAQKAAAADARQRSIDVAVAEAVPALVEKLAGIRVADDRGPYQLVEPDEREQVAAALRDPARALAIMDKLAGHLVAAQAQAPARLGGGVPNQKQAGYPGPHAGRRSAEPSPSWEQFRRQVIGD